MSKFKEYLKEQYYDIKGMYSYGNGETSVKGSKIGIPPVFTPKMGIKNLRVGVEALAGWSNPVAIEACMNIMNFFGTPNILTNSKAKWFKVGGFDKISINDETVINYSPKFHIECVYGTKNVMVPPEFHTPLAAVSQSFMFDNLKQQITARCSSIVGCAIMMGFAEEVIEGVIEPNIEEFMERYEALEVPDWFERATGGVGAFLEFEDRKHQEAMMRKEMIRTGGKYGRGYHWKLGRVPMDMEQDLNIKESLEEAKKGRVLMHIAEFTPSSKEDRKMTGDFIMYAMKHKATATHRTPTGGAEAEFESKAQRNAFVSAYDKIFRPYGGLMTSSLAKTAYVKEAKKEDDHVFASWKKGVLTWSTSWGRKGSDPGEKWVTSGPKWRDKAPSEKEVKNHLQRVLKKNFTLEYRIDEATKPQYVVDVKIKKGTMTPMAWDEKRFGKPSKQGLAKMVKAYNDSMKPGGANEHLGKDSMIIKASVRKNAPNEKPIAVSEEVKMNVDWKRMEDPDETEYLDDVLSKAKKMGDDEMIKRIMTMLKSKEKNITDEYPK
jgi:hypothetical protein